MTYLYHQIKLADEGENTLVQVRTLSPAKQSVNDLAGNSKLTVERLSYEEAMRQLNEACRLAKSENRYS